MRIQTVVQHDPRRAHLLPSLLAALPRGAQVVTDPGASESLRSPWRCYRACLETLNQTATHLLVVQDDLEFSVDFPQALRAVVAARPRNLVALFVPGAGTNYQRVIDACRHETRWCHLSLEGNNWVPTCALIWPRPLIPRLLAYYDRSGYPSSRTADDGIVRDWAREEGVNVLATVPSLVEHPDNVPSLMGKTYMSGRNPARVAACWAAPPFSPLELEW